MSSVLFVVVVAIVLVAVVACLVPMMLYNGLVQGRNRCGTAFAGVETQLQRRHDLIPTVVDTVKGAMAHERHVLDRVISLRSAVQRSDRGSAQHLTAEHELGQALATVMARTEAYPELRANENALHLQRLLAEVEEQLAASRRTYNSSVESYNNKVQTVPSSLVAAQAGFAPFAFFEAARGADQHGGIDLGRS